MKKIKIDFIDFWEDFDKKDNIFYNFLKTKYDVEISKSPDYVFCSLFGKQHLKYNDKIKILVIGENIFPDFNLYDYAIGFYDIHFRDRYLQYNYLLEKDIVSKREHDIHSKFCAFVYTKNKLNPIRKEIFEKLSEYKKVDSGGGFLNNIGGKIGKSKKDKLEFQKQYKFIIACENQSYPEYNTEKLLEAFASGGIPIYWGDPEIDKIYNKEAFINCRDFKSLDEVKEKVIELDNDDKKYLEMLNKPIFNNFNIEEKENELKEFLTNIFEQDYEMAKRIKMQKGYYIYEHYKVYFPAAFIYDKFLKIKSGTKRFLIKYKIIK